MRWRNSFAVVAGCTAASLMAFNVQAQSAFAGFYGQVSTGYEGNQFGTSEPTIRNSPNTNTDYDLSSPSQNFGGAPLVFGLGYYWQASDKWLIGLGADYSALTQSGPTFTSNF
jgi:hypothetical protein